MSELLEVLAELRQFRSEVSRQFGEINESVLYLEVKVDTLTRDLVAHRITGNGDAPTRQEAIQAAVAFDAKKLGLVGAFTMIATVIATVVKVVFFGGV